MRHEERGETALKTIDPRTGPIRKPVRGVLFSAVCLGLFAGSVSGADANRQRIRPWEKNPRYWQYKGDPVLLVGGSKDDNLFQLPDLEKHLDEIKGVGGNFVRNTMSDRPDKGFEVYPYEKRADGKYDLNRWNVEYWRRFENFLRWTGERGIFVQIEVWDRFDHSQENWEAHPYRPANNVNYSASSSGLGNRYPAPAWRDRQPFFHTVPGMPLYKKPLDVVRKVQERFVAKLLSYSLRHGHVLYCMDNETSTPPAWGRSWIAFIEAEARKAGVSVYCTDMFDKGFEPERTKSFAQVFADPGVYKFIELSQINSRLFNEAQWTKLRWVMKQVEKHPRPVNHVKIYGSGETKWGSGTPTDGVERMWRDLLAGSAAVRHHRDGGGIGLQPPARACIQAVRKVETLVKFWEVTPHQELLGDREPDEAYLTARPGDRYVLYFTQGGAVSLNLGGHPGDYRLKWVNVSTGEWGEEARIAGGRVVPITAPGKSPYVAVIVRQPQ